MPVKMQFRNLSKTRIARGYTQRDMGEILKYRSYSRYAQYETGDRKPNVIEALRIAKVLGATVEHLFATDLSPREEKET
jgi:transcriptional regulator with XRE-family HTH domain